MKKESSKSRKWGKPEKKLRAKGKAKKTSIIFRYCRISRVSSDQRRKGPGDSRNRKVWRKERKVEIMMFRFI